MVRLPYPPPINNKMRIEKINEDVSIGCEVFSNSRNWGHIAKCFYQGREVESKKVFYQNRTWETFQFDTVKACLVGLLDKNKTIPLSDRIALARFVNRTQ